MVVSGGFSSSALLGFVEPDYEAKPARALFRLEQGAKVRCAT